MDLGRIPGDIGVSWGRTLSDTFVSFLSFFPTSSSLWTVPQGRTWKRHEIDAPFGRTFPHSRVARADVFTVVFQAPEVSEQGEEHTKEQEGVCVKEEGQLVERVHT